MEHNPSCTGEVYAPKELIKQKNLAMRSWSNAILGHELSIAKAKTGIAFCEFEIAELKKQIKELGGGE